MSDYDERPDWREIDRLKDKSRHYGRASEKGQAKERLNADRWNTGRRKEALDRLFKGEKGTPEHDKFFNKIHKSYGTGSFLSHVKAYIEKYGLPDDVSTLLIILDAGDKVYAIDSMDKLKYIFNELTNRQKEDVKIKLSIIKMTNRSAEIREKAEEVLSAIAG